MTLIQPTFVTHPPKELVPLAKLSPDDPTTVEVFECRPGNTRAAVPAAPRPGKHPRRDPVPAVKAEVSRNFCSLILDRVG